MAQRKIAIQGERGAFSEVAARILGGSSSRTISCESFDELFDKVESGKAANGVIPIENSLIGSIHRNYDLLLERQLHVVGETQVRVRHCLIAPKGTTFGKVSRVYSHPAALEQCRKFFKTNPTVAPITYYDTAGAVKMLSESGLTNSAAIAGPYAAEFYKMKILKKAIEDEPTNFTRFLMLSKKPNKPKGRLKTSIVFSIKNQPGALFKVLSVFALRDIDLTRIESRPVRKRAWEYVFYVDFDGSTAEERVINALDHLGEITHFIKILGSYTATKGDS